MSDGTYLAVLPLTCNDSVLQGSAEDTYVDVGDDTHTTQSESDVPREQRFVDVLCVVPLYK